MQPASTFCEKPARILFIITQLDLGGGAERQLYLLVKNLNRKSFIPSVLSLKHGGEWAHLLRQQGVPVIELRRKHRLELSRLTGLWRGIREFRPDLVVTSLFTANTYGRLLSLLAGVPHRVSLERGGDFKTAFQRPIESLLAHYTDVIVFNSAANQEQMQRMGIRAPMCTIPNGIDIDDVNPDNGRRLLRCLGVPEDAYVIGKVAQLHPRKGHDLFLQLAQFLSHRKDIHFVLVGDGPERDRLAQQIHLLNLGQRVTFTGRLIDPRPVMACFRVNVLTSLREGLPNALMEAMALGIPSVVSSVGGTPELITDGIEGFLVTERDPRPFSQRISTLLDDPVLWERMSQASRSRIKSQFSVSTMVTSYERLFHNVIHYRPLALV